MKTSSNHIFLCENDLWRSSIYFCQLQSISLFLFIIISIFLPNHPIPSLGQWGSYGADPIFPFIDRMANDSHLTTLPGSVIPSWTKPHIRLHCKTFTYGIFCEAVLKARATWQPPRYHEGWIPGRESAFWEKQSCKKECEGSWWHYLTHVNCQNSQFNDVISWGIYFPGNKVKDTEFFIFLWFYVQVHLLPN